MCCNVSKNVAPQLHMVASTWLSYVEIPVQRLFLGIASDLGLTIFGGDTTDVYTHSPEPSKTYLDIDDAYSDWYEDKVDKEINRNMYYLLIIVYKVILNLKRYGCILLITSSSIKWNL